LQAISLGDIFYVAEINDKKIFKVSPNPNIVSGELFEAIEEELTLAIENGNFIGVKT